MEKCVALMVLGETLIDAGGKVVPIFASATANGSEKLVVHGCVEA